MRLPNVSIVMPTYNRAHLLPYTVDSVLQQSWEDFELIVVDDGSTDGTRALIGGYDDARLVYVALAHTGNLSKLRNYGIRKARGEYLAFLDSDDLWQPDKLQLQVELLERLRNVGIVLCGFEVFDAERLHARQLYRPPGDEPWEPSVAEIFHPLFQGRMPYYPSTVLFRKSLLHATALLDERLRAGDHDFMLRLAFHAKAAILHQPLVRIRKHDGNLSLVYEVEGFEQIIYAVARFYATGAISRQFYKAALVNCHKGLGKLLLQPRNAAAARRNVLGYVRLLPVLVRAWAHYVCPASRKSAVHTRTNDA